MTALPPGADRSTGLTQWVTRLVAAFGAVVLAVLAWSGVASAHAALETADPGQGSVLLTAPAQVVLHFSEPVTITDGSVRVLGPRGQRVDEGGAHHPGGEVSSVAVALPSDVANGTYIVAWRVISADSHPVHGAYTFSVGTAAGVAKSDREASAIAIQAGSVVVGTIVGVIRFLAFLALIVFVGLLFVIRLAWVEGGASRRVRMILRWSWAVLAGASVAGYLVQGVYASELPLGSVFHASLLSEVWATRFGQVEIFRLVLLMAAVPVVLAVEGRLGRQEGAESHPSTQKGLTAVVGIVGLALLATPGLAGHASTGVDPALGLLLDVVHVASAALWLGGLVLLATFLVRPPPSHEAPDEPVDVTLAVSSVAFVAVLLLIITGLVQSFRQVGSVYALIHTTFGRLLLLKVALVVVLVVLGWLSRRVLHGKVRQRASSSPASAGDLGRLRTSVVAELAVAVAVLVVTAFLVNAVPARQAVALPFATSWTTLGVQVNADVAPARVGPGNAVHIYVLSSAGRPNAVPELDATLTPPGTTIGPIAVPLRLVSPGHYSAEGVDLPLAGTWVLKVKVRTTAIDEDVVQASFGVH